MEKVCIKILIVLYNKKVVESETITSLINCKKELKENSSIIIWNNSFKPFFSEEIEILMKDFSPLNIEIYGNDGNNTTLPHIYTTIYSSCKKSDILVLFDHDTNIPTNFFKELYDSIVKYKNINLFLPIICYSNNIVSPSYTFGVKGLSWKTPKYGQIKSSHITAINSGMAIRCSYLIDKFEGYNMELKFYETDNDFMAKYALQNTYLYVLNSTIRHTLNFYEDSSIESKLKRFKDMKYGRLIRLKSISKGMFLLGCLQYFYFGFKCALIYKDYRFIDCNFKLTNGAS